MPLGLGTKSRTSLSNVGIFRGIDGTTSTAVSRGKAFGIANFSRTERDYISLGIVMRKWGYFPFLGLSFSFVSALLLLLC